MTKLLIVGNAQSPLIHERGQIPIGAGFDVHWYSPLPEKIPGAKMHNLPRGVGRNLLLRALFEPIFLESLMRRIKPDLVHVHYASKGLAAIPLARRHPLLVSTMGGDIMPDQDYRPPYKRWIDNLLSQADIITTKSSFMKRRLIEMGNEPHKIEIVSWGVDSSLFYPRKDIPVLKAKWGIPDNVTAFLDPRSAHPQYNKDLILRAFAKVKAEVDKKLVLLVAAFSHDARYLKQLKKLAVQLGIYENVRFLGKLDQVDIAELMNISVATISVPDSDGMPQTIYEAMACGSFLIVGDLPQYDEILHHDVNARRVKIGDVIELASAMQSVISDPSQRERVVTTGLNHLHKVVSKDKETEHLLSLYTRLLSKEV